MKQKVIFFVAIFLCVYLGRTQGLHVEKISESEFASARITASKTPLEDVNKVSLAQFDDSLVIKCNTTMQYSFHNSYSNDNYEVFRYVACNKNLCFINVEYLTYEKLLIIDANGNMIWTHANHILFQDYLITYDIPNNDNYYGISIFKLCNEKLNKIADIIPDCFISFSFYKNDELFFSVQNIDSDKIGYYKLKIKNV